MAETTTLEAAAYTAQGTARERVPLPADLFDGTVNVPVMHQAVKAYLANQRQGNAKTKKRGEVSGGNSKPWKQKGTGRARQGSTRAPHWVGGGTVFGPQPRSYAQYVPRQVRALARKSAFNARARENALIVIDRLDYDAPKTRQLRDLLAALGVAEQKVLVLTDGVKPNVYLSARNLPLAHAMPYSDVSTYHLLWSDVVLVEASALGQAMGPADDAAAERPSGDAGVGAGEGETSRPARGARAAAKRSTAKKGATAKAAAKRSATTRGAATKAAAKRGAAKRGAAKRGGTTAAKGRAGTRGATAKRSARGSAGKSGGTTKSARKSAPRKKEE